MTPSVLFKYINSIEHAAAIASGSLKFTAIPELNDPVEMLPSWNDQAFHVSLDHVRKSGCTDRELELWLEQEALMERLAPQHMRVRAPKSSCEAQEMAQWPIYDDAPLMRTRLNAFVAELRRRIGVLSLTTRFDSLPMWAHYAANASGCLVAYKNIDVGLPKDAVAPLFRTLQVDYGTSEGVTFYPDSYRSIFLRKLPDWQYENEWRVIADLQSCACLAYPADGRRLGTLVEIDARHVAGFFAGWRMTNGDFTELHDSVRRANPAASVVRLDVNAEGWPDFSPIENFLKSQAGVAA